MISVARYKHEYWRHPDIFYELELEHLKDDCELNNLHMTIAKTQDGSFKKLFHGCYECGAENFIDAKDAKVVGFE